MPKHVSIPTLKSTFFSSFMLHSAQTDNPNFKIIENQRSNEKDYQNPNDNPIKGIFVRLQAANGIVVLAFYDVRDAAKTKRAIEVASFTGLAEENDADATQSRQDTPERKGFRDGDGDQSWKRRLSCTFITPEDLGKVWASHFIRGSVR